MLWLALVLGVVEGLTEFLPISSTGHLIVVSHIAGLDGPRSEVFSIFIQLGAVLAVVWEYRVRLYRVAADLPRRAEARWFTLNVFLAFVPAAVIGLLFFHPVISENLFRARTVAAALIAGAILILIVESLPLKIRTRRSEDLTTRQALLIGLAQCFALWPGFSRSAATILGGLLVGLDRRTSTEFSFFLAIPTLGSATIYDLVKNLDVLEPGDVSNLAIASIVSFVVAWVSVRWLLRFVSTHDLRPFAWYRIVVGLAVLVLVR